MRVTRRGWFGCLAACALAAGMLPLGVGVASPGALPQALAEEQGDAASVDAADIVDLGVCGSHARWSLDSLGVLRIEGTGVVDSSSWSGHASSIVAVGVEEGITSIVSFRGCSELESVSLPSTLVELSLGAFRDCGKLVEVSVPAGVESLPAYAFSGCAALRSVTLGDELVSIGANAFYGCSSLEAVELPGSVEAIGENAFRNCAALAEVELPASLSSVGSGAFDGCSQLRRVDFLGELPDIAPDAFGGVSASAVHHEDTDDWASLNKAEDFGGDLTWYGVAEDGTLVEDSYVYPSYYDPVELAPDTWDTRANIPTGFVAWHFSVPTDQTVELSYSYNYDEDCSHHSANLRLLSSVGNEGTQVWSEVFAPALQANGEVHHETLTLAAGDYYLLGSLRNTHGTYLSSFSVRYELSQATEEPEEQLPMYRCYNPYTGEHLYTASGEEYYSLCFAPGAGWEAEGVGWVAPASGAPVYRLYNPYVAGGDHHYTLSASERDALVEAGWRDEGVGWYSASDEEGDPLPDAVPLWRQYNPYAETGTHNYTADVEERDHLVSLGWHDEGIGWYGYAVPEEA